MKVKVREGRQKKEIIGVLGKAYGYWVTKSLYRYYKLKARQECGG
ncbi:unnamed protein product [marine sediment metagenome]|uniref:Uncharacterized protein n=1 Tax=marine sediment metagenome TaxID=412755 RepID=X1DPN5_9ZZZZ